MPTRFSFTFYGSSTNSEASVDEHEDITEMLIKLGADDIEWEEVPAQVDKIVRSRKPRKE